MTTTRSGSSAGERAPTRPRATWRRPGRRRRRRRRARPSPGSSGRRRRAGRATRGRRPAARALPATAARTAASRRLQLGRAARAARASIPAASPSRVTSSSTSPRLLGSCCSTRGGARQPRRDLDHVLEGDRADVADGLGDDQVRRQLGQPLLVEAVERLAFADDRLHRGVDLAGAEPVGEDGRGQVRQLARRRRVVALVGDRDHVAAQAEREQHLGRRGDEAGDPHPLQYAGRLVSQWCYRPLNSPIVEGATARSPSRG